MGQGAYGSMYITFHTIFMIHTVNHVYPKNEAENRSRILYRPAG